MNSIIFLVFVIALNVLGAYLNWAISPVWAGACISSAVISIFVLIALLVR